LRSWTRTLAYVFAILVVAGAYFIGRASREADSAETAAATLPDPGYAARDAEVIETGYDGRERYRLTARIIRQQTQTGVIDLEDLAMDYHPAAQAEIPGEVPAGQPPPGATAAESWNLRSDRGQVRADGDDVQLNGNVVVNGPAPGTGAPLKLSTDNLRINTPTEFIETKAPVRVSWSGHELTSRGMEADLKAGTLRLESEVHGEFSPKK
jgi:LPS export ABC transporter protein LptC